MSEHKIDHRNLFDLSDEEMLDMLGITDEDIVIFKLKYGKEYRREIGTIEQFGRAITKRLRS